MNTNQATTPQAAYIVTKMRQYCNQLIAEANSANMPEGHVHKQMLREDAAYNAHCIDNFMRTHDLKALRNEVYAQDTQPREDVMSQICLDQEHGLTYKFFNEL